ncbi:peptide ABC transporter substrate-binding protein [Clostridium sp. OF03-18AA]|nr:peptide ABC transporter substrate-binding protein [Clostridium sp. MCC344]RHP67550.1 peptide ABC transporter substrate-binding protein [Clostridium sp. OF03-18AA]
MQRTEEWCMKKTMLRIVSTACAISLLMELAGCQKSDTPSQGSGSQGTQEAQEEKKEKTLTEYSTVYTSEIDSVNYLKSTNSDGIALFYSIMDGLIEFDRFGEMIPCIAADWTVSNDELTYTFHLRDDVKWYDWKGNAVGTVKAQNFVDGIKWILNPDHASSNSKTVYDVIKNAKEFYEGDITDFSQVGVKAIDDTTVEYTLYQPTPYFIKELSFPCFFPVDGDFLEEQGEMFGLDKESILYCGAYLLTSYEPQSERVLEANPDYWNYDVISIGRLNYKYNSEANSIGAELFTRGEINDFLLPGSILDEWMEDPEKKEMIRPNNLTNMSYFIGFNFDPNYDETYKPEDWKIAVNNENFRQSIFHGFDREAAILTVEPYNPKEKLLNTFTRRNLVQADGVDYTMMGGLAAYTEGDSFDPDKALEYKEKAMAELEGQVTFPIQILVPFSTAKVDTANRMQVMEQQLEKLLGTDYINIVLESHPSTGFTKQVRTPGAYSMMEMGWGPDFADPLGMMNPVHTGSLDGKYMRVSMAKDLQDENGSSLFEAALDKANAETKDLKKRYELFADAECMLLDKAILIPFYTSGGGYRASYLDPFSGYTSQMGRNAAIKLKGAVIMDKPMGMSEYEAAEEQYEKDRAERMKK